MVLEGLDAGPRSLRQALLTLCDAQDPADNPHLNAGGQPARSLMGDALLNFALTPSHAELQRFVTAVIRHVQSQGAPLTIHFDYGLDMAMYGNPALRSLLKGSRLEVPGQFHKTHLAICPLGNDHFAFWGPNYGSRHGEQILVEQLVVSRIAYDAGFADCLSARRKI